MTQKEFEKVTKALGNLLKTFCMIDNDPDTERYVNEADKVYREAIRILNTATEGEKGHKHDEHGNCFDGCPVCSTPAPAPKEGEKDAFGDDVNGPEYDVYSSPSGIHKAPDTEAPQGGMMDRPEKFNTACPVLLVTIHKLGTKWEAYAEYMEAENERLKAAAKEVVKRYSKINETYLARPVEADCKALDRLAAALNSSDGEG